MRLKKNLCQNWKLYVITDPNVRAVCKPPLLVHVVEQAIAGGADVIQLRDKTASDEELLKIASTLLSVTRPSRIPLIINDRVHVAKKSGADGVHLGQEDGSLKAAREILGEGAIIGRSTHSREQALEAVREGFDYIGVGPVFPTPTKPDYAPVGLELVQFAAKSISIPFVAIGGIDTSNAAKVVEAGAKTIAVVRAVMRAEDPKKAAEELKASLRGAFFATKQSPGGLLRRHERKENDSSQ